MLLITQEAAKYGTAARLTVVSQVVWRRADVCEGVCEGVWGVEVLAPTDGSSVP